MEPTEAIDILRGTTSPASVLHPQIAADMGAEALTAWEWVNRTGEMPYGFGDGYCVPCVCSSGDMGAGYGPTPLAAVLDAMKKEATDGR